MNKIKYVPGPALKAATMKRENKEIHDLVTKRLAGTWANRGALAIDPDGVRYLIVDDGQCLKMGDIRIEGKEPLSVLARILSEKELVLLDRQMSGCNVMLSATEALEYIKESGLKVSATDGTLYRYQNGTILTGKETIGTLTEGRYLPERVLLLFSTLES